MYYRRVGMDEALYNVANKLGLHQPMVGEFINMLKQNPSLMQYMGEVDDDDDDDECEERGHQQPTLKNFLSSLNKNLRKDLQPTATNVSAPAATTPTATEGRTTPYDMIMQGEVLYVTMEVPGVCKSDIDITVGSDNTLLVGIEKRPPAVASSAQTLVKERKYGYINRSIQLPKNITLVEMAARYEDGVLTVRCSFVKKTPMEHRVKVE